MIDKIKELLGEELATQVTEKLGDVELAIFNDGSVVPATKFDGLKKDYKALEDKQKSELENFNTQLEEAMKKATDYDTLKSEMDKFKADSEKLASEYEQKTINIKKDNALEVALLKGNADEAYLKMLKAQVNLNDLQYEEGNVKGVDELIKGLQDNFPKLFGEQRMQGGKPPVDGLTPQTGKKADLISQYEEARKKKDFTAAFAIQKQIQQLK